jgi:hypothetical protein
MENPPLTPPFSKKKNSSPFEGLLEVRPKHKNNRATQKRKFPLASLCKSGELAYLI